MEHRNQWTRLFSLLFLWLAFAGCGSGEVTPDTDPTIHPDGAPSCETLEPRLFQDPLTGGEFHCLWCNRNWKWTVPADSRPLFVLIAFTCERLRSEAYLEIRDAQGSIVWQREMRPGVGESYCIRHESPTSEVLSVRLCGTRDLLLLTDLIEEFHGSIYLKVFDGRGHLVMGPDS
ncbi:MAG: hypothetical protein ACWGSD_15210 [Thermodesulfobacteriota bacterium]